jgi:uncharacterized membrane protein
MNGENNMVVAINLILIGLILLIFIGYTELLTEFLTTRKYWSDVFYWLIGIAVTFLMFGVSLGLITILLGV